MYLSILGFSPDLSGSSHFARQHRDDKSGLESVPDLSSLEVGHIWVTNRKWTKWNGVTCGFVTLWQKNWVNGRSPISPKIGSQHLFWQAKMGYEPYFFEIYLSFHLSFIIYHLSIFSFYMYGLRVRMYWGQPLPVARGPFSRLHLGNSC